MVSMLVLVGVKHRYFDRHSMGLSCWVRMVIVP
jgi:hypothetical protein